MSTFLLLAVVRLQLHSSMSINIPRHCNRKMLKSKARSMRELSRALQWLLYVYRAKRIFWLRWFYFSLFQFFLRIKLFVAIKTQLAIHIAWLCSSLFIKLICTIFMIFRFRLFIIRPCTNIVDNKMLSEENIERTKPVWLSVAWTSRIFWEKYDYKVFNALSSISSTKSKSILSRNGERFFFSKLCFLVFISFKFHLPPISMLSLCF